MKARSALISWALMQEKFVDVMASAIWKCLTLGHLILKLFALGVLNSSFYLFVLLNFEHSSVIKKNKKE